MEDAVDSDPIRSHRSYSSDRESNLRIEEISDDDIGYDGDIEVMRPDEYEDAKSASDAETNSTSAGGNSDLETQLAVGMKKLNCDLHSKPNDLAGDIHTGQKRQSKEMSQAQDRNNSSIVSTPGYLEVMELLDTKDSGPPHKRRKGQRKRRSAIGQGKNQMNMRSRSLDSLKSLVLRATSPISPISLEGEDADGMDLE